MRLNCPVCYGYGRIDSEREFSPSIPLRTAHGTEVTLSLEYIGLKDANLCVLIQVDPFLLPSLFLIATIIMSNSYLISESTKVRLFNYFGGDRFPSKELAAKDLWRIKQLLIFIRQNTLADCNWRLFPKIVEFRSQKPFDLAGLSFYSFFMRHNTD